MYNAKRFTDQIEGKTCSHMQIFRQRGDSGAIVYANYLARKMCVNSGMPIKFANKKHIIKHIRLEYKDRHMDNSCSYAPTYHQ